MLAPSSKTEGSGVQRSRRRTPEQKVRFHDEDLYVRLRESAQARPGRLSCNQWILEAIAEKLAREGREPLGDNGGGSVNGSS